MKHRMSAMVSGMHFRFLSLVLGVAALLLAAQLFTDTSSEIAHKRQQRIDAALGVTNVIARSLEKQFNHFDLDDIESILVSVRKRGDIRQLSVVDRDKTFFLDGDLATSPVIAVDSNALHDQALSTGKPEHLIASLLCEEFDVAPKEADTDIRDFVDKLRACALL